MKRIIAVLTAISLIISSGTLTVCSAAGFSGSKPSVTVKSGSYNILKISWKKVDSAKGYEVFRKVSGGSWKKVKTTKSVSFTDSSLSVGKKYYYRVRGYKGSSKKVYTKYSATRSGTPTLSTPKLTLKTPSLTKATLSWKKIAGAKGYTVYRKVSNGSFKKLKTVKTTSLTLSSLKLGTTYTYKIRAYRKRGSKYYYSSYSSQKSITPSLAAPKIRDNIAGKDSISIYWNAVSGADSYEVYYKVSGGIYNLAGTTSKTNYTLLGLVSGRKYYFKVRAVRGSTKGAFGAVSTISTQGSTVNNPSGVDFGGAVIRMATNGHYMFSNTPYMRKVEAFEKAYNCSIVIDDYDFGTFNNSIYNDANYGIEHDIVLLHGSMLTDGVNRGIYADLSSTIKSGDYLDKSNIKAGGIDKDKTSYFTFRGKNSIKYGTYAVCNYYSCYPYVIYYNKLKLAEAGFSGNKDPRTLAESGNWSWNDIRVMGEKINKQYSGKYLLSNSFSTRCIALCYGAPVVRRESVGVYKENVSSKNYLASLELIKSLFATVNAIGEPRENGEYNQYKSMLRGETFMFTEESYKMLYISRDISKSTAFNRSKSNIGVVEVPLPEENTQGLYPSSWLTGIACTAGGNKTAAVEWAKFCSTYTDSYIDTEDFDAADEKYVKTLYDRPLCFEVGNFYNGNDNVLNLAEGLIVSRVVNGCDPQYQVNQAKDRITACINATVG